MRRIILSVLSALVASWLALPVAAAAGEHDPMVWPMQQGETLRELAHLIYPKNKAMRARLIAATLELNRNTLAGISADEPFAEGTEILLPHPYTLSAYARPEPRRHAPAERSETPQPLPAPGAGPAAEQSEEYKQLTQRQQERKQKLQALNQRLGELEQKSTELNQAIQENNKALGSK